MRSEGGIENREKKELTHHLMETDGHHRQSQSNRGGKVKCGDGNRHPMTLHDVSLLSLKMLYILVTNTLTSDSGVQAMRVQ